MRKPLPTEDLDLIVDQTAEVWSAFDRARLFVTGGTGFIGSWLLEVVQHANRVRGSGIEIVALSRDPDKARAHAPRLFASAEVTLVKGDVTDFRTNIGPIDLCIHAATDVADPAKASDRLRIFDTNVIGTRNVLDFAQAHGASRFLLTSSGAIYGTQPSALSHMPETFSGAPDPLDVDAAYGQGKRAAEWLVSAYGRHSSLRVTIARIYALIGPGIPLDGPFAAGNFIRDALAGHPITINGDGRPVRSYLYMADACIWLFRMLLSGECGHAYNVGSEREISIIELARMIESLCGSNTPATPRIPPTGAPAPRYVPDTAKARSALDVEEITPFERALLKTINWNRTAVTA
ncbi:NAD-dependent epimerase/dehydratase family protein [Paraburkholderia mimosarum]|uniref:NAD-dependent epimerase/dehydratase family protein n=1 Tax=Paraburkholderia mimosarum TaxID=312026 RepID=UPI0004260422|nr:NAD-dependent epimerase/dehydratase family protein [Paraburkholderia mimosarum]